MPLFCETFHSDLGDFQTAVMVETKMFINSLGMVQSRCHEWGVLSYQQKSCRDFLFSNHKGRVSSGFSYVSLSG